MKNKHSAGKAKPIKTYKIEKGIKIPPPSHSVSNGKPSSAGATFSILEVGDSFLVKDPLESLRTQKSMRDFNTRARSQNSSRQFASRKLKIGTRFWRLK